MKQANKERLKAFMFIMVFGVLCLMSAAFVGIALKVLYKTFLAGWGMFK